MAENSKISWTDHTFNPWVGCTKVSPGCDHCYAEGWAKRSGKAVWGAGQPRARTSLSYWQQPVKWNNQAKADGTRAKVFCASLADVFDNEVDPQWRQDLWALIMATPHLDWLLLTKRIGNASSMLPGGEPLANLWLGATVVNQEEAERDIPKLLATPAWVRFLSIEPLLGPLDLSYPAGLFPEGPAGCCSGHQCGCLGQPIDPPLVYGLDWVIVGGESGGMARPMEVEWARVIRDQCQSVGVRFFMKQLGGVKDKRGKLEDLPEDLRIREFPGALL